MNTYNSGDGRFNAHQLQETLLEALSRPRELNDFIAYHKGEEGPFSSTGVYNHYENCRYLTRGGVGAIFDAKDKNIRRKVAVKMLLAGVDADHEQSLRFIHEAQVTGQLEHPNIVPVHELGVSENGISYYTMKFVKGVTLKEVIHGIRNGKKDIIDNYPLNRLLTIFMKTCDAVSFAHSKTVIHRDLKPENIMIGEYGEVLVLDWGLAKLMDPMSQSSNQLLPPTMQVMDADIDLDSPKTLEGSVMGTPAFMSPEQIRGKHDVVDERSDIYTLGCILYMVLTLKLPVQGKTIKEILRGHIQGNIIAPTQFNLNKRAEHILSHCPNFKIPGALSAICMKALALDKTNRYSSVVELQKDIEKYQAGFATNAEQAGYFKLLYLSAKRHWREISIVTVSAVLIIGIIVAFAFHALSEAKRKEELNSQLLSANDGHKLVSKMAAPEFLTKAKQAIDQQNWAKAEESLELAAQLDPDLEEVKLLNVRYNLIMENFSKADRLLGTIAFSALKDAKSKGLHQEYNEICNEYRSKLNSNNDLSLSDRMDLGKRFQRLRFSKDLTAAEYFYTKCLKESVVLKNYKQTFELMKLILLLHNPRMRLVKYSYKELEDGIHLELKNNKNMSDIRVLALLPLVELDLSENEQLYDLSSLRRSRIRKLDLREMSVPNLSALIDVPIEELNLNKSKDINLSQLNDMPIKRLNLKWTTINSLEAMSIETLEDLDISFTRNLSNFKGLSEHANLKHLNMERSSIKDLSLLKELKIESLNLSGTKIKSLAEIGHLRLKDLNLQWTEIVDLNPLRGMPLKRLNLYYSPVENIDVLRSMPLEYLNLGRCSGIKSLNALENCNQLKQIVIPRNLQGIQFLKSFSKLKSISYSNKEQSADLFWKSYTGD